jgi:3-oxoacyl-(acyl-carrier-protein) synthase
VKKKAYIIGSGCISPQNTIEEGWFFDPIINSEGDFFKAIEPSYKEHINPNMLRRMGRAIKMGAAASRMAMEQAQTKQVDAIISGTGLGCFEDSERFLLALLNNDEQFLTPTSFIQSTHNTVGSQIALLMQCHNYNFTYVHRGFSFESCVMDALMGINEGKHKVMIGGIEEHTPLYIELNRKADKLSHVVNFGENEGHGVQMGEGATFFILSDTKENAGSAIDGIGFSYKPSDSKELLAKLNRFLDSQNALLDNIDLVLFGLSGDKELDKYLLEIMPLVSNSSATGHFKHLCGEYHTAGAFGTWVADKILSKQQIPDVIKLNHFSKSGINSVLIVNAYLGINYSFTLMSKC